MITRLNTSLQVPTLADVGGAIKMIKEGNEGGLGALLKPGCLGKALKRWHSSGESRDEHGAVT